MDAKSHSTLDVHIPTSGDALNVFISYARVDASYADELVDSLEKRGISVTIDRRDLPYGEQWQTELADFIGASDTVIWLVSPESSRSQWCNWELGEVARRSKRLLPVRIRDTNVSELPESLGRIHLLPAEGTYDADRHLPELVRALHTDQAWLKKGTDLGRIAQDWIIKGRDKARLLRGKALSEAELWSNRHPRTAPPPSSDVLALILASRAAQRRTQRITVAGSLCAAVIALALASAAVVAGIRAQEAAAEADAQRLTAQSNEMRAKEQEAEADRQRKAAETNEALATEQRNAAIASESARIVSLSGPYLTKGRPDVAMGFAMDVAPRSKGDGKPLPLDLELILRRAVALTPPPVERHTVDNAYRVAVSHDGRWVAVGLAGNSQGLVQIFDAQTMTENVRFTSQSAGDNVSSMAFSADDKSLAVAGGKTPGVWDVQSGKLRYWLELPNGIKAFTKTVEFSPDGTYLALSTNKNFSVVYSAASGTIRHILNAATFDDMVSRVLAVDEQADPIVMAVSNATFSMFGGATDLAISPNSSLIAVTGQARPDGSVDLFDAASGRLIRTLADGATDLMLLGMTPQRTVSFSPDSRTVYASPFPGTIKAWSVESGILRAETPARDVTTFIGSDDGRALISGHHDGSIVFRCMEGLLETTRLQAHSEDIEALTADYVHRLMVTTSDDGTAKVWRLPSSDEICVDATSVTSTAPLSAMKPFWTLPGHLSIVLDAAIAPDGGTIYTSSRDGFVRAWKLPWKRSRATNSGFDPGAPPTDNHDRYVVASRDERTVFVAGDIYEDFAAFDVATGDVIDLKGVRGVSSGTSAGKSRLFRDYDTFWDYGTAAPSIESWATWKGVVSSDGKYAIVSKDGREGSDYPVLVDVEARRYVRILEAGGRMASEYDYVFSPDGKLVFADIPQVHSLSDSGLGVWDTSSGRQLGFLPKVTGYSNTWRQHLSFDGRVTMVESYQNRVVLRLTTKGLEEVDMQGVRDSQARTISPDGTYLLEGYEDGTVGLRPIPPAVLPGPTFRISDAPISFLAVSPDGVYAAAGDIGRTLTIFGTVDGTVLQTVSLQESAFGVAFLPERGRIIIVDTGGNIFDRPIIPMSDTLKDGPEVVDWIRATRHSVLTDSDRATYGLIAAARGGRPDLKNLPRFQVALKKAPSVPNELAAQCDRLAANPFDRDRRASGIVFEQLDVEAAMPICQRALASAPTDRQLRYQVGRLSDRSGKLKSAVADYLIAAKDGSAIAMRGISRLLEISEEDLGAEGTPAEWADRAAHAGDPWSIVSQATDLLVDDDSSEAVAVALGMLEAAQIPNRAQAAMTLGVWLGNRADQAAQRAALFMSLLGLELNDTMTDEASNSEPGVVQMATDLVRDRAPHLKEADAIETYRRARDWRRPPAVVGGEN